MSLTPSTMLPLGTVAPGFRLADTTGSFVADQDFNASRALVVMFICNHCPYVVHIREGLAFFGRDYAKRNVGIVAINSNDASQYPEDSPEAMAVEAAKAGFTFPYLFDPSQEVAKAYRAACTPDVYLFDADHRLVYRGQFDGSRPGNSIAVSGADLRAAVDAVLDRRAVSVQQIASIGCNIKWKPGNQPDYFGSG